MPDKESEEAHGSTGSTARQTHAHAHANARQAHDVAQPACHRRHGGHRAVHVHGRRVRRTAYRDGGHGSRSRGLPVHVHQFRRRFDDRHGVGLGAVARHRRERPAHHRPGDGQPRGHEPGAVAHRHDRRHGVRAPAAGPHRRTGTGPRPGRILPAHHARRQPVRELRAKLEHGHARQRRAGAGHGHHGRRRRPQHGAGPSVHPGPARPRARHPGGGLRHGDHADDPSGRHAVVVRQAREDGAHRPRGRFARDTPRSAEGGRVRHAHAGARAGASPTARPPHGAARNGRCCWEPRCASRRSPSSLCGA